ncbi:UNVERIFIED_CONTAM: hypothetical protein GTU68_063379, partial [Idotea baltica]|nr:hypothetical protein [Idotea baltica]
MSESCNEEENFKDNDYASFIETVHIKEEVLEEVFVTEQEENFIFDGIKVDNIKEVDDVKEETSDDVSVKEEYFGFGTQDIGETKKTTQQEGFFKLQPGQIKDEALKFEECLCNASENCRKCSYSDSKSLKYNFNENLKSNAIEKPFGCEQCSYQTTCKGNLVKHQRIHSGEKPYKCGECSYRSARKGDLVKHQRKHPGENLFKCGECSYSASLKCNLVEHLSLHAGVKSFKCEKCPYTSSRKRTLVKHLGIHLGEKSFKCEKCSYSAAEKRTLMQHIITHTGEKLHKC